MRSESTFTGEYPPRARANSPQIGRSRAGNGEYSPEIDDERRESKKHIPR